MGAKPKNQQTHVYHNAATTATVQEDIQILRKTSQL